MRRVLTLPLAIVVTAGVLAGCGSAAAKPTTAKPAARSTQSAGSPSSPAGATPSAMPSDQSMAGMVMPATASGSAKSTADASAGAAKPSATAALVCGSEIRGKVKEVLKLKTTPKTTSTFSAGLFTCSYDLPMGRMLLSVQESATTTAARAYLQAHRRVVKATEPTPGLGERAYSTGTGIVLVVKDNDTLQVDTTRLPAVFGSEQQKRTDLAYEIASDVLGCWTGDDDS
jgi:hypothetical protein